MQMQMQMRHHTRRLHLPGRASLLAAGLILVLCQGQALAQSSQRERLEREAFNAIKPDPPPKRLILDQHFLVSNEKHLEYFYGDIPKKKGGLFIGVGTDQNFVFAGWARPNRVVVVDFDQWVVDLFDIYAIAFAKAKAPAAFIQLWSKANRKQMRAWIKEAFPEVKRHKLLIKIFNNSRNKIFGRLNYLHLRHRNTKTPCFLNDPAQYRFIVSMFAKGRWHAFRGDFKGTQTFTGIAAAARKFKLVTRVFYLSNVEDYLTYTAQYKANIQGVPTDAQTMTLRTSVHKYKKQYLWAYITQTASDYKEWLALPGVKVLKHIVGSGKYKRNALFRMTARVGKKERKKYGKKLPRPRGKKKGR